MATSDSVPSSPDTEKVKLRFQLQLSTWPTAFQDAETILELAQQNPEQSRLLSACACLVLASVLDQATSAKLIYSTENEPNPMELPESYAGLRDGEGTFKDRVDAVPEVLTGGRLQLDRNNIYVKSLYQLIRLRNVLVHVREGLKGFEVEITREEFQSGAITLP